MNLQLKSLPAVILNNSGVRAEYSVQYSLLRIACFIVMMGLGLVLPLLSVRIIDQGISLRDFGIIQSIACLLSVFTQVGIGKYSDRIGQRKPLILAGLLLMIPTILLFPQAKTLLTFGILLSLVQMSLNTFMSMTSTWVSAWSKEGELGRLHGSFKTAFSFGWIVSTLTLGALLDNLGFDITFYIAAIILMTAAFLIFIGTHERLAIRENQTLTIKENIKPEQTYNYVPKLKVLFIALGLFILAQSMGFHLNNIFFMHELKISNQQFGWLSSIQAWPEIPLMLILGIASDRFRGPKILAVGMALGGLRWLLLSFATSTWHLLLIQPFHAIGITVSEVLILAVIARMVPTRFLGAVMGWKITVMSVSRFLAPLIAGAIGDYIGIRIVFGLSGVLAIISALVILQLAHVPDESQDKAPYSQNILA